MKLSSAIARRIQTFFAPQSPFRNVSRFSAFYSTETLSVKTKEPSLYRRISPLGSPNAAIVPLLDQWVSEGRNVDPLELRAIIRELRRYRRHRHALEISQWMTERSMVPSSSDVAIRLQLIAKVHTIEQAQNFFDNTPNQLKTLQVYGALLFCYSEGKYVDKAEATMQKMRELGFPLSTLNYNNMLNLYFRTGNREKVDTLINEMKLKSVKFDRFTYATLINAYGANNDIDGVEKIMEKLESDPDVDIDWAMYGSAAIHYHKCGLPEKALSLLKKGENLAALASKKHEVFSSFLTFYTTLGIKEDVLRVWEKCKEYKLSNQCYKKMMSSILKFNDIETAETVLCDWEASHLSKDIRIPNFLIKAYYEKGEMEKAEALIEKGKSKGWEKPNLFTWYWMSLGYVKNNQMGKAIEAMEHAISERFAQGSWKPEKEALSACVKYLKEEGDKDRSDNFVRLLQEHNIISMEVYERLVEYFSGEYEGDDLLEGYGLGENTEHLD